MLVRRGRSSSGGILGVYSIIVTPAACMYSISYLASWYTIYICPMNSLVVSLFGVRAI